MVAATISMFSIVNVVVLLVVILVHLSSVVVVAFMMLAIALETRRIGMRTRVRVTLV